jgi:NADH-quinone oxidoreductase subunit F
MTMPEATERPLTRNIRPGRPPLDLKGYEAAGGYAAARKAVGSMSPGDIMKVVKDSNLRGRGGAGFPTGLKWSFVPMGKDAPRPKYLVCNADEMEPGTMKDRVLLEGDPHRLVEGMVLAARAIDADIGYVFIRGEYEPAIERVGRAVDEARAAGYLGKDILGSGWSFDLHVHGSAGRYICGEETALLNALEGRRANPRAKPPFPQVCGLFGKPTIVQNVETLCNLPAIVERGAEWFKKLSRGGDGGTKLYGASGRVRRPGVWELPMGVTAREIIEEHAGGMRDGYGMKGWQPGGASTDFLLPEHLDVKMDFDSVTRAGSRLGTGTIIVLDDRTCPVGATHNLTAFFAQESCGWCTPCREGLPWARNILEAIEDGRGEPGDIDELLEQGRLMGPGLTFCALAPGAAEPLLSALKHFRADFEAHIGGKRCPWR